MKSKHIFAVIAITIITATGCAENKTRVGEGAGVGGLLGAGLGGIIGHQSGHGWEGALIGGAVGATGGALAGSQIDKPSAYQVQPAPGQPVTAATTTSSPMTMQQIVDMTKQGSSSDDIIAQINASKTTFVLTSDDLSYLRSNGVSQRVIEAMQASK